MMTDDDMKALIERLAVYGKPGRGSAHPQNVACREAAAALATLMQERDEARAEAERHRSRWQAITISPAAKEPSP